VQLGAAGFFLIYAMEKYTNKLTRTDEPYDFIIKSIVNEFFAVILTVFLYFTFKGDGVWIMTLSIVMTGFGNLIIQVGVDMILFHLVERWCPKQKLEDIIKKHKEFSSCLEFSSMLGQTIAFLFLLFGFLLNDHFFSLLFAWIFGIIACVCGFVSLIWFGFIHKSFEKDVEMDVDMENPVNSRNTHFDSEIGGRSVVFRGVSKRH